ncbi:hypothetical protein K1T73_03415 [Roseovarius sp. SCSIO 43702]|uniref:hypothetical protein n=1 Tax=Roseovarius sp. SCSIO 43702 TaxID=2823043 RepID=UPI001C730EBA|nr:hypothetical protein [Roseovarius sp. SCSIO 43702]QYX57461.1 hypothetical protein K1T73_03415 [Roseovarius sp. SCSIO 43702]
MSDRFHIPQNEHGLIRVFSIDLPPEEIPAFTERDGDDWPLRAALGAGTLDPEHVEVFPVSDLTGVGLSGYLNEGLGVAEADLAADRARLDGLTGHVLIVRSRAFEGREQHIMPQPPLRWIGTWREESAPVQFEPLPSESAAPSDVPPPDPARPERSDAAISGRVAMIALLVIFAMTALMIWMAT